MPRMVREDWGTTVVKFGNSNVQCNCGTMITYRQALREHWQQGCFDYVHPDDLPPKPELADSPPDGSTIIDPPKVPQLRAGDYIPPKKAKEGWDDMGTPIE